MSTISDVARVAGVSEATVSRALRGLDKVNPRTRERVLQVAEELNYVASPTAASLASGRTRVVGVVTPFLSRWFFATLISGVEKTLRDHGHHVLLFDLEDDSFDHRRLLTQSMLWKRVDGVVALNIPMEPSEQELLVRLDLPVVTVGDRVDDWPCVHIDDMAAAAKAVDHLISLGHRRIAYVGAVPEKAAHGATPRARLQAFREVMAANDLPVPEEWILPSDWTADGAIAQIDPILQSHNRPTALVAASDEIAIGLMAGARRRGIAVPRDLSIIGIDDHYMAAVMGLSTVRQDIEAQGRAAGELLMSLLEDGEQPPADVVVPTELVVRDSTGPAPD
ncbi:MAG: LacI family transcriptional regulator [Micrococcales bacterium]|nr:LacI family transcriptional regulator [Micrococcales bacterium]